MEATGLGYSKQYGNNKWVKLYKQIHFLVGGMNMNSNHKGHEYVVYVGTYTDKNDPEDPATKSEGIYSFKTDSLTGAFTPISTTTNIKNPTFITIDDNQDYLYSVTETGMESDNSTGNIYSYKINKHTAQLDFVNTQPTNGLGPCYISINSKDPKCIVTANYGSGSVALFPILENGSVGNLIGFNEHEGSGVNQDRQEAPHAHFADYFILGQDETYVFSADLGADKLYLYKVKPNTLELSLIREIKLHDGAGPRHLTYDNSKRYIYLLNELDSTVTVFDWDKNIEIIQTVTALPKGYSGESYAADIHISPSGKFLLATNRGDDSIAVFSIEESSGKIQIIGHTSTQGGHPRNFAIIEGAETDISLVFVANQDSNNIVTFKLNESTGELIPNGQTISVPAPVCIKPLHASGSYNIY